MVKGKTPRVKMEEKIFSVKIDNRSDKDNKVLEKIFDYFLINSKIDSLVARGGRGWAS